jgi:hypothetical protein
MMRESLQTLVDALLVIALIALVPFAWLMRDGLGPNAVASSGLHAMVRCFVTFYSGPVVIALAVMSVVCRCARKKKQVDTK